MRNLNLEQKVACLLQRINTLIAICAFIPASLSWFFSLLAYTEVNEEVTDFSYSSVLLIVFYGYTIISPRIYINDYYNKSVSFWHWVIVLITNGFTIKLFLDEKYLMLVIVPIIPLVLSIIGLSAHYFINFNKTNSNENNE